MKVKLYLLLITVAGCLMAFTQMSVSGKWAGHLIRPHSTDSARFEFDLKQTNDQLTGVIISPDGKSFDIDSGKVSGSNFSFSITEAYGPEKISGSYYADSLGTNIAFPNGHKLHMKMLRIK